jgi:hypothetical protein
VPEGLVGHEVKCPACGGTFIASLEGGPAPGPERPAPPKERRSENVTARDDRDYREDDYDDRPRRRSGGRYEDEEDDYDEDDRPRRRRHYQPHRGSAILTMGILSFFIFTPVLGPMAWIMGSNDLKEIRAGRMDPEGESSTATGRVCGMISTIICGVVFFGFAFCCLLGGMGAALR